MKRLVPHLLIAVAVALLGAAASAQESRLVDDAALENPPPSEWLSTGYDQAETHYSPLDRLQGGNVGQLRLAWTHDVIGPPGRMQTTPLVSDGVMYATGPWSVVFALDARTGEVKWEWDPAIVRGGRTAGGPTTLGGNGHRGVAIYRGKVARFPCRVQPDAHPAGPSRRNAGVFRCRPSVTAGP